jgi:hypothetical protein
MARAESNAMGTLPYQAGGGQVGPTTDTPDKTLSKVTLFFVIALEPRVE